MFVLVAADEDKPTWHGDGGTPEGGQRSHGTGVRLRIIVREMCETDASDLYNNNCRTKKSEKSNRSARANDSA
jgi:hypothetical protein